MHQKKPRRSKREKIQWMFLLSFVMIGLETLLSISAWAYEGLPGFTGKQLTGTVKLDGKLPVPTRFNLVLFSDPYYCGRISDGKGWRLAPMPTIGEHDELAGAVVFLEDVKKGKLGTPSTTMIKTQNCVFLPYVTATQVGHTYHFRNWDPIQHKLEVFLTSQQGAQTLIGHNLEPHPENRKSDFLSEEQTGLHRAGPEIKFQNDRPGLVVFRCGLHDYMEGWSLVVPHPYFFVTGKNGKFSLKDIPPGIYNLIVWHPLGKKEVTIDIGTMLTQDVTIFVTLNSRNTDLEEEPMNNPFGIDLVGDSSIVPVVELQEWNSGPVKAKGDGS